MIPWLFGLPALPRPTRRSYLTHKEAARELVHSRLEFFGQHSGIEYGRVSIRNTKTRWGSCSKRGNLNFNYRIVFLKPELVDYLVVHELAHLKQFNHSPEFWAVVATMVPEYARLRRELKKLR